MRNKKFELFSETALTILVSVVTLLLQLISFATTWSGSRIYLEGVFPYASLFFAIAIQATAYFFSNSLRNKISVLKVVALALAICCSTYYSYIGIYNSVNSPERYLQEKYAQIRSELIGIYESSLEGSMGNALEAINDAASAVTTEYIMLSEEGENIEACYAALSEEGKSYASGMRAPKQSAYENYEDYVAAYNAYIAGISEGSNVETQTVRAGILASYGYSSMQELQLAEAENAAALSALEAALGVSTEQADATEQVSDDLQKDDAHRSTDSMLTTVSDISVRLAAALDMALQGQDLSSGESADLSRLYQGAKLCGYQGMTATDIGDIAKRAAEITGQPLMADYNELVEALEGGKVTASNTMDLKSAMDSEILTTVLRMNALLGEKEQISYSEERYAITDLYLIPVQSLVDSATRMTALFCLGMAALVDMLSVLFAVSLRGRKVLWKRKSLAFTKLEDYAPQIYASLPLGIQPAQALSDFLACFGPSPHTESEGYMMRAEMTRLKGYYPLVALLCQVNLAKVIPVTLFAEQAMPAISEAPEESADILLLKARFVFWVNAMIYEEQHQEEPQERKRRGERRRDRRNIQRREASA